MQNLLDTCFYKEQARAGIRLNKCVEVRFKAASLEVFHNNYKNVNLRSVVFECTQCEEALAFDYCTKKQSSDPAGYKANILDMFKFFKVEPDKEKSV